MLDSGRKHVPEMLAITDQWRRIVPLSFTNARQKALAWEVIRAQDTRGWRRELLEITGLEAG